MAMTPQEKFEYWLNVAQRDLDVAETLLNNRHWLYVAFMCQQAVEKIAKGLYLLYLNDDIPRTHNIRSIVGSYEKMLPVEIPLETRSLFVKLSTCYLNNRYPEYKEELSNEIKEHEARALYSQTQEVCTWLLTLKP
jgi:HEPN domain-containing protein